LQQAIEESKKGETIKILQSKQQNIRAIVPESKDIVIDLNGNTISTYGTIEIIGNLEITDTTNNGKIESHTVDAIMKVRDTGTVKVVEGNISGSSSSNFNDNYGIYNQGIGRIEISRWNS